MTSQIDMYLGSNCIHHTEVGDQDLVAFNDIQ